MILSVIIAAPNFFAGIYAVLGVLVGGALSFTFLKIFKRRNMWSKIALKDRLTKEAGYSSLNEEYEKLVGKTDRKSTRLNSSHVAISYAVFCLKKKTSSRNT